MRWMAMAAPLTRLTKAPGKHTTTFRPMSSWIADIYSYTNKPPDLFVQENQPMAETKRITTSPTPSSSSIHGSTYRLWNSPRAMA